MARVLAFAVSAAALVAPPTQQTRRPVTARAVVSEPIPSSVSSKDTLVAAAEAFDLQGYFAKKVQAVEKALDASIQCTTPETKKIVESMRYSLLAGGKRLPEVGANFFAPTVLGDATVDMKIFREETFGPVAPLFKFKDEAEAVAMANDTPYGLAAYFFTRDLGRAWRVSEGLDYGLVGCNEGIMATEVAPFGGMKESGLGREGSKYGVDEFIEAKYVLMGGIGAP